MSDKAAAKKVKRSSELKRKLQSDKRRLINRAFRSSVKTALRSFKAEEKGSDQAKTALQKIYSLMDRGVSKGVFKKNTAARIKSRMAARV